MSRQARISLSRSAYKSTLRMPSEETAYWSLASEALLDRSNNEWPCKYAKLEQESHESDLKHLDIYSVPKMNPSENEYESIYNHIMELCPLEIRDDVKDKLMLYIHENCKSDLDPQIDTLKYSHKKHFPNQDYKSKEEKEHFLQIEIVFKAAIVYYMSLRAEGIFDLMTTEELLEVEEYSKFANEDPNELMNLLNFRNYMKVALNIIPPKLNKRLLMGICALLEGIGKVYVTGGAQVPATTRRVTIYEKESCVKPQPRAKRRSAAEIADKSMTNATANIVRKYICECGSVVKVRNIWRHNKTIKHLSIMATIKA